MKTFFAFGKYLPLLFSLILVACVTREKTAEKESESNGSYSLWLASLNVADSIFIDTDPIGYNENGIYRFIYNKEINGYNVNGTMLNPDYSGNNGIIGTTILEFESDQNSFTVTHPYFFINNEQLGEIREAFGQDSTTILFTTTGQDLGFYLEYMQADDTTFLSSNVPFFFKDVDFDGKEELLLTYPQLGQRGISAYRVYSFNSYDDQLASELYQVTDKEPYKYFDDLTVFDSEKNEIIITFVGGAYNWRKEYYRLDKSKRMSLYKIEDVNELIQSTYIKEGEEIKRVNEHRVDE